MIDKKGQKRYTKREKLCGKRKEKVDFILENVKGIKAELAQGNRFGERVFLVAATKMQTAEAINRAVFAGVDAVAENKPQEFRDKNEFVLPCPRHFIGHLQTNKIKYLIGKIDLYHSCDRYDLLDALAKASVQRGLTSNILLQINIGNEESKGGFAYGDARKVFARASQTEGVNVKGFMAMLPDSDDENLLRSLARQMRELFEWAKKQSTEIEYLSMGMSGDYKLCVEEGSNMIRVGSTIFGARNYATGN